MIKGNLIKYFYSTCKILPSLHFNVLGDFKFFALGLRCATKFFMQVELPGEMYPVQNFKTFFFCFGKSWLNTPSAFLVCTALV